MPIVVFFSDLEGNILQFFEPSFPHLPHEGTG